MTQPSTAAWLDAIARPARVWSTAAAALLGACADGPTAPPPAGTIDLATPWVAVAPESVGLDATSVFVAAELAGRVERMRSLLLVKDGRLALERYYAGTTAETPADVRSVTKSVVSTLVGIALEEGDIQSLDQRITDFLPASRYELRAEHALVRIRHLLTMTGGFSWSEATEAGYADWILSDDHVGYLLRRPLDTDPGAAFRYNTAAVHLLGIILEEATGTGLAAYADRVLFGPMGIDVRAWEDLGAGSVNGGAGLDLRPRDLARLGQLVLQEGWSGERLLVPSAWIEEATVPRFDALGGRGPIDRLSYGFLWWLDEENDAYFAWGYGGQFLYVVPRLGMVVVATTEWRGLSGDGGEEQLEDVVLNIIVERLLPAAM